MFSKVVRFLPRQLSLGAALVQSCVASMRMTAHCENVQGAALVINADDMMTAEAGVHPSAQLVIPTFTD